MQYDLPLFLVCVRTNVGYCAVAEFITQSETTEAISEALKILKEWNPNWNPPFVLCDYSEAKFQQSKPYFSQFKCTYVTFTGNKLGVGGLTKVNMDSVPQKQRFYFHY